MSLLTRQDMLAALRELGQLAFDRGVEIELFAVGGAVMALRHCARDSTRDIDVLISKPSDADLVRKLVQLVAVRREWPNDWLNDAAKGYLQGIDRGPELLAAPGIQVFAISDLQMLAMKLSAWRDEVDILDARVLLRQLSGTKQETWSALQRYLVPGSELKAQYAFEDLWDLDGHD